MSFSKGKRESIKIYMLDKISSGDPEVVKKTADTFDITQNTVYRYLRELTDDKVIVKKGRKYRLFNNEYFYSFPLSDVPQDSEDRVFTQYIEPHIVGLSDNVFRMWAYCFTEMMNNIIDHSQAELVRIYINQDFMNTSVVLSDDGIGIFRKIQEYYRFASLEDAIVELFKGKLTTDKARHSGEGIFFSSRIMDVFAAISDGKVFSHTEFDELLDDLSAFPDLKNLDSLNQGTSILMKLSNHSRKTAKEVFDQYADVDGGFIRTIIPLKNIFSDYPVSRSQAKRLTHRLEVFKEVQLDFAGIDEIGQGFAHELFVVFRKQHPDILLVPFNTNSTVQKMITHVTASE